MAYGFKLVREKLFDSDYWDRVKDKHIGNRARQFTAVLPDTVTIEHEYEMDDWVLIRTVPGKDRDVVNFRVMDPDFVSERGKRGAPYGSTFIKVEISEADGVFSRARDLLNLRYFNIINDLITGEFPELEYHSWKQLRKPGTPTYIIVFHTPERKPWDL